MREPVHGCRRYVEVLDRWLVAEALGKQSLLPNDLAPDPVRSMPPVLLEAKAA